MIEMYEQAKELFPELRLVANGNHAEIYMGDKKVFDAKGGAKDVIIASYFAGMIKGAGHCVYILKKSKAWNE